MIYVEDQQIKVNGVVLPGLLKSIEVTGAAKVDEQEVEGSATKPKQATGYEDAKVNIELILDDTTDATKHQRLETLRTIFRAPGQTVPQPIPIVSQDTAAHGIDKVIFKTLQHKAESKRDQLAVTLEFWEYVPQTIKATKSSKKKSTGTDANLNSSYTSYLSSNRGKSPAIDNAPTSPGMARAMEMPF
ncbi:MAG TPA: transcriptional regulator [Pseudoflavonifractor sp.]|nr:transcriptional regulator [Pseudoflavonifractor sp.]